MGARVRFEATAQHVGLVTLDRPDKRNAMDEQAFADLHDAAAQARRGAGEGTVRAVLVRGAGSAFSSGIDVGLFAGQVADPPTDDWIAWLQQAFTALEDLPVPTVAAVQGPALGAGCQLALACHLRVASPDAEFGLLEARWGLLPDLGATYRLPRLVGLGRATDLAVTARTIDAATAHDWGLVDAVLDGEDFAGAALDYAGRLAAGPTVATGMVCRLARENLDRTRDEALAAERAAQAACLASEDFGAVVAAAGQRSRPSPFRGR